ncbi:MAG: carboxymuconolactone decarboxylase family protein [Flavobacterium nitrogenifigens]|uniref:Alkylhydroperoxidase AhpD family core domain-containing protein n=1 Tax=Flavobacterium nitrogenifigens TaxID=1617283 RepID=A0A521EM65_9FLAO|nr:carboxymuconolactone decarboxylase family protein [Flavobacterium nitrogenifigens]KAF2326208.1 carboxymuconolactone decarboxylase family protein [Flavobacterium nitrogenifigens]MDQ8014709.1 carboxymuconolactone decarboxylase family protein [Flavobacterium nitrogenifigens]SMO85017.1 alkylhydroperoxidase AhpD family core domain-containing protein [Flavobacterium nitrogenifigens]
MKSRIIIPQVAPEAYQALMNLEKYISSTSLTPIHKELIKIRASQINGCAYCINMHTADARKLGISEQRIYLISAWREADFYTDEEKAILALTEQVTLINNHVSDEVYQNAAQLFDEKYLAEILLAIITINSWNRLAITTGMRAV